MAGLTQLLTKITKLQMTGDALAADWATRGETVALMRRYDDGDHDANMTDAQKAALRLARTGSIEFNDNYMPIVIDTYNNRLRVARVEADNERATAWAQVLLDANRFDRLQNSVHRAAIRDGESFILVWYDNAAQQTRLTFEPAFDGISGTIPVYFTENEPTLSAVIKIWHELIRGTKLVDLIRVNVYYPDRVERFISNENGSDLLPYTARRALPDGTEEVIAAVQPWVDRAGQPLGIPFFHFKNRPRGNQGISEIANAIPLQDALNRTLHSLVMAAEKTGFQNRVAIGFAPPDKLEPGAWVIAGEEGLRPDQQVSVQTLEAGDLSQLMETMEKLATEIGNVTSTPAPELFRSDNLSGEAFKQREASLIGKIENFQLHAGAEWEAAFDLAWRVEDAFAPTAPPDYVRFATYWRAPTLRSDAEIVESATKAYNTGAISKRAYLRLVAPVFGWDDAAIEQIMTESSTERQQASADTFAATPDFRQFSIEESENA